MDIVPYCLLINRANQYDNANLFPQIDNKSMYYLARSIAKRNNMIWDLYCETCQDNLSTEDLKLYLDFYKKDGTHWVSDYNSADDNSDSDEDNDESDDDYPEFTEKNYNRVHSLYVPVLCSDHWCECMPDHKPYHWSATCTDCNSTVCCECKCGNKDHPYCRSCWDKYDRCKECGYMLVHGNGPHKSKCSKQ